MTARSYLFVPGDRESMLANAAGRGADAVIADLEDAVAPSGRSDARRTVATWLSGGDGGGAERWIRANPDTQSADLEAVAVAGVSGIVLPKIQSATDLSDADQLLSAAESRSGALPGTFGVIPMVETAGALGDLGAIASAPRVRRLIIGEMDLGADLGINHEDWDMWLPIRIQIVVASAAAGLPGPVGPVARDFTDLAALRAGTDALRRMGFRARAAIHPAQLPAINECFTASPADIAAAARLVEQFDGALAAGRGAAIDDAGKMVDEAAVRRARDLLERSDEQAT